MNTITLKARTSDQPCYQQIHVAVRGEKIILRLDVSAPSQRFIYDCCQAGMYEALTVVVLNEFLAPDGTFIDVGAHVGFFTLIASALVGKNGRVISFEPNPDNAQALRENVRINGLANTTLFESVVGAVEGNVPFFENIDNDGGHAVWEPGLHPFNQLCRSRKPMAKEIPQMTLDRTAAILGLREISGIKIDTEGAECNVIQGAGNVLTRFRPKMIICEHNAFGLRMLGRGTVDLLKAFHGHDYRGYFPSFSGNSLLLREVTFDSAFNPTGDWPPGIENIFFRPA